MVSAVLCEADRLEAVLFVPMVVRAAPVLVWRDVPEVRVVPVVRNVFDVRLVPNVRVDRDVLDVRLVPVLLVPVLPEDELLREGLELVLLLRTSLNLITFVLLLPADAEEEALVLELLFDFLFLLLVLLSATCIKSSKSHKVPLKRINLEKRET